jgi:hypothetical protein
MSMTTDMSKLALFTPPAVVLAAAAWRPRHDGRR